MTQASRLQTEKKEVQISYTPNPTPRAASLETPWQTPMKTPQEIAQSALSEFPTPAKYYPIQTDKNKKIHVLLSPSAKKTEEAIYKFRQKSTGTCYIGMASRVGARASKWMSAANNSLSEAGQQALAKEIRKNPDDFEFGIVVSKEKLKTKGIKNASLGEIEALYIEFYKQKGPLFNKRGGNGGGVKKRAITTKKTAKEASKQIRAHYHSPEKSYPLDSKTYKVLLTPSAKGDLYIIKRIEELVGENASIRRYVGRTDRPDVRPRLAEHSHFARHPEKIRSQQSKLYQDMHKFPEQFEVKLLDSNALGSDDIDMLETGLIEFFKEADSEDQSPNTSNSRVYNKYAGGNGSHAAPPIKQLFI